MVCFQRNKCRCFASLSMTDDSFTTEDSVAQIVLLRHDVVLQPSLVDILFRAVGGLQAGPPPDLRHRCSPKVQHFLLSIFSLPGSQAAEKVYL